MLIKRLQVEEGFLDSLDLTFTPGLNTLIGGRGTGKTSVIELIRFCLGARNYGGEAQKRTREHVLAVLGSGEVSVTIEDGSQEIVVSRTVDDEAPRNTQQYRPPLVFSQSEIERLGLEAKSRLRLIDSFRDVNTAPTSKAVRDLLPKIRSLTSEISDLVNEIDGLKESTSEIPTITRSLREYEKKEQDLSAVSTELKNKQELLAPISKETSALTIMEEVFQRTEENLEEWLLELRTVIETAPDIEDWPDEVGETDKLKQVRSNVVKALKLLTKADDEITDATSFLFVEIDETKTLRIDRDEQARKLRKEIEEIQQGAGEITKHANALREKLSSLQALQSLIKQRSDKLKDRVKARQELLDTLDEAREETFLSRSQVAQDLSRTLGPSIRVEIIQSAQYEEYVSKIIEALRGSSVRYNQLAPQLAKALSPRELSEAAEKHDTELLMEAVAITQDRASRVLSSLSETGVENLITADVEDDIQLQLLDGIDYKSMEYLSTGQRCTIVLPLIMEHKKRLIVVDQPEDHLDNAFIVGTLIKAIRSRSNQGQMILSTHNANIPVLGESSNVILLESDGQRGFLAHRGHLDELDSVRAITDVMEGGEEAFKRRAEFYKEHLA